jgi:hypothetical protein
MSQVSLLIKFSSCSLRQVFALGCYSKLRPELREPFTFRAFRSSNARREQSDLGIDLDVKAGSRT